MFSTFVYLVKFLVIFLNRLVQFLYVESEMSKRRLVELLLETFLKRDLLLTAAICHDIGKTKELSLFPVNDYTDEGQFLGHIVMGAMMVGEKAALIEGFPELLKQELQHCIVAHHGEFEYGSPKKPAIMEAVALNLADNTDAKMETFTEILQNITTPGWQGFNKFFETNIFETKID